MSDPCVGIDVYSQPVRIALPIINCFSFIRIYAGRHQLHYPWYVTLMHGNSKHAHVRCYRTRCLAGVRRWAGYYRVSCSRTALSCKHMRHGMYVIMRNRHRIPLSSLVTERWYNMCVSGAILVLRFGCVRFESSASIKQKCLHCIRMDPFSSFANN